MRAMAQGGMARPLLSFRGDPVGQAGRNVENLHQVGTLLVIYAGQW